MSAAVNIDGQGVERINAVKTVYRSSHGSTLSIEFEYPEENPPDYLRDITAALNYAGVFAGIGPKMPPCTK